jgi:hypothetical protein
MKQVFPPQVLPGGGNAGNRQLLHLSAGKP